MDVYGFTALMRHPHISSTVEKESLLRSVLSTLTFPRVHFITLFSFAVKASDLFFSFIGQIKVIYWQARNDLNFKPPVWEIGEK